MPGKQALAIVLASGTVILLWIGPSQDLQGGELWALAGRTA